MPSAPRRRSLSSQQPVGGAELDLSERWARREDLALLTDFYQLTMMAGYLKTGRHDLKTCFNYTFRELPPHTGFAVCAGLEQLLDLIERFRFTPHDLAYLRSLGVFDGSFLEYLGRFRITCSISAIPEGSLVFPNEPILQVEGPLIEAQLLETAVLNTMNYATLVATKAARIRLACGSDALVEFGLRRAHGPDGGLTGSRAAYIGGADSTSNMLAGKLYGIPVTGTHAHSWVMSFPDELSAFRAYAASFPKPILLVDTYDTLTSGLPNALTVFKELRAAGRDVRAAVRLDSGDLARLSKAAYRMFTEAGFDDPLIVASNELTEDLIADLKRQNAPINSWGVGTHLITSSDWPALGGVYKLVAVREPSGTWVPRIKLSSNQVKMTDPGRKRVQRYYDPDGHPLADVVRLEQGPMDGDAVEAAGGGRRAGAAKHAPVLYADRHDLSFLKAITGAARLEELLRPVMKDGRRVEQPLGLDEIRGQAQEQIARLPEETRRLRNPEIYLVGLSPALAAQKAALLAHAPGIVAPTSGDRGSRSGA
jgi:nicotinate phosphoribosyltransferase